MEFALIARWRALPKSARLSLVSEPVAETGDDRAVNVERGYLLAHLVSVGFPGLYST